MYQKIIVNIKNKIKTLFFMAKNAYGAWPQSASEEVASTEMPSLSPCFKCGRATLIRNSSEKWGLK